MKTIRAGHLYELQNFENKEESQTIQFIEKVHDENGKSLTLIDGTTNEEVLEMIIDRLQHLNTKIPCRENALAITNLEQALMWLEKRTKDRIKRGIKGKHYL